VVYATVMMCKASISNREYLWMQMVCVWVCDRCASVNWLCAVVKAMREGLLLCDSSVCRYQRRCEG
jgi:hypothetical protein